VPATPVLRANAPEAQRAHESCTADVADRLLERPAARAGCERTVTFDKRAAKAAGVTIIDI